MMIEVISTYIGAKSIYIGVLLLAIVGCQNDDQQGRVPNEKLASGVTSGSREEDAAPVPLCGTHYLLRVNTLKAGAEILGLLISDASDALAILANPDSSAEAKEDATRTLQHVQDDLEDVQGLVGGLIWEEEDEIK